MQKVNWKKFFVFTIAGTAGPVLANYTNCLQAGACPAFTAGNVLLPIGVGILVSLGALFTNPWKRL